MAPAPNRGKPRRNAPRRTCRRLALGGKSDMVRAEFLPPGMAGRPIPAPVYAPD
jgi:hypothetical protein